MKLKSDVVIVLSTFIVLLGIGLTYAFGFWTTESTKIPGKLPYKISSSDSAPSVSGSTDPQAPGLEYDPADIKGSYTFKEISNLYKVPLKELAAAFMVEESAAATFKCKDLMTKFEDAANEIGTASMRLFVSYYYGLDYASTETVYLPETAVIILKEKASMTPAQLAYLESHTVKK